MSKQQKYAKIWFMKNNYLKLGIIGYPLSHSISPIIQCAALKSTTLNGFYDKFEIQQENLQTQLKVFIDNEFSGFNVTIPYKIEIMKYIDWISPEARQIGAINTVKINKNGTSQGYNTDIYGFTNSIPINYRKNIKNAKILGCGGAALAVIYGLQELGTKNITIYVRNKQKASQILDKFSNKINSYIQIEDINLIKNLEDADILVNATPLGTKGENQNKIPINSEILKTAPSSILVYDLVYNPQQTLFIKSAKNLGLKTINGLEMLILQGAKAFEIWTSQKPSLDKMKAEAIKFLNSH